MNRSQICTLNEALDYYDRDIVERFLSAYDMPCEEADAIFVETKKWLWLLAVASQDRRMGRRVPRLVIDNYLLSIDEMWHNFILFTKLYRQYCLDKFGFFIHHNPTPQRAKQKMKIDVEIDGIFSRLLDVRKEQYSYVYDKLGADTLELWYGTMCDKYTQQYLSQIRK